jgi:hypothetical protein
MFSQLIRHFPESLAANTGVPPCLVQLRLVIGAHDMEQ